MRRADGHASFLRHSGQGLTAAELVEEGHLLLDVATLALVTATMLAGTLTSATAPAATAATTAAAANLHWDAAEGMTSSGYPSPIAPPLPMQEERVAGQSCAAFESLSADIAPKGGIVFCKRHNAS